MTVEWETWAEQKAKGYDQTVKALKESAERWLENGINKYTLQGALDCLNAAEGWEKAADDLRRPKSIRLEQEAYGRAGQ